MSSNSLDEYRIVVAAATYDELDKHDLERRTSTKDLQCSAASSVVSDSVDDASTVDIDNTHPYLIRYAEIYAEENNTDTSTATQAGPIFVNIKASSNKYNEGDKVIYAGEKGDPGEEAVVTKVEYDADRNPQYTIKITPSMEKSANGATDENGETPTNSRDFKTNSTSLFQSLYEGKWKEAEQCLSTNPEEARIWVARYAKKESTTGESTDEGNDIRWQLLPLHLYIALGGRSTDGGGRSADGTGKETKSPPIELLNALLLAYPQATQCTDDQSMIPLHSAIRGNSSLAVIQQILEVDPASVYRKDSRNRNAFVLAEKVYGKIHKQPVGSEDESRQLKYAHLMSLLSNAATRVATTKSQPKQKKAQADAGEKKTQLASTTPLQKLQIENLALRRENAMLHHRAEINGRLLQKLVEKLQIYEDERSGNIENYNEIFGSKDECDDRREEILTSISEDAAEDKNDEKEEKQKGGGGAYNKRLERYLYSTPTKSKDDNDLESPATAATEATTPFKIDNSGEHSDILSVSDYSQDQQQDIFRSKDLNTGALIDTAEIPLDSSVVKDIDTANPNISIDSSASIEDLHKVTRGISAISPVLSYEEEEMLVVE